jgi:hypothetical protein
MLAGWRWHIISYHNNTLNDSQTLQGPEQYAYENKNTALPFVTASGLVESPISSLHKRSPTSPVLGVQEDSVIGDMSYSFNTKEIQSAIGVLEWERLPHCNLNIHGI